MRRSTGCASPVLNQAGDNHCWLNGDEAKIPPFVEFIQSCVRHHAKVAGENGVLEGCMTIAQLEAEVEQLRSRLAVHEAGVPEVMQGAMNEIRRQAAHECATIADEVRDESSNAGIAGGSSTAKIQKWGCDICDDIASRIYIRFGLRPKEEVAPVEDDSRTVASLESDIRILRDRLTIEIEDREERNGTMRDIRAQTAKECAAIAETYCSNSGRAITAAIREKFGVNQ